MLNKLKYTVIGLMSGTSLDGLDICAVNFERINTKWSYNIIASETIKYSENLKERLKTATSIISSDLLRLDIELGELFGNLTKQFIVSNRLKVDFIASHGHTVFHQPSEGFTLQIGNGQEIANRTALPVIFDFRSKDVSLGGQGAPLVPIGDELLFSDYDACINFGGIANVSFKNKSNRVAFDICPFNMGLNYLANELELDYDESGEVAKSGALIDELLIDLNDLDYYKQSYPKSLGIEWFNQYCLNLIKNQKYSVKDRLHTFSHHIAIQLAKEVNKVEGSKILITGGGVYNVFVIDLLKELTDKSILKPNDEVIDFKEALIFAFLGVLRFENQTNVLKSVTGASKNSSSGVIVYP